MLSEPEIQTFETVYDTPTKPERRLKFPSRLKQWVGGLAVASLIAGTSYYLGSQQSAEKVAQAKAAQGLAEAKADHPKPDPDTAKILKREDLELRKGFATQTALERVIAKQDLPHLNGSVKISIGGRPYMTIHDPVVLYSDYGARSIVDPENGWQAVLAWTTDYAPYSTHGFQTYMRHEPDFRYEFFDAHGEAIAEEDVLDRIQFDILTPKNVGDPGLLLYKSDGWPVAIEG